MISGVMENANVRKGRFLWLEDPARKRYVEKLIRKIENGYFFSERVMSKIVDEIAPTFNEIIEEQ